MKRSEFMIPFRSLLTISHCCSTYRCPQIEGSYDPTKSCARQLGILPGNDPH